MPMQSRFKMKSRIRRISASVDNALSFGSGSASTDATSGTGGGCHGANSNYLNASTDGPPHGYNPCSKSLDICVPESRIDRMRKLLSSPLLRRRNASQHAAQQCGCSGHHPGGQQHAHHHSGGAVHHHHGLHHVPAAHCACPCSVHPHQQHSHHKSYPGPSPLASSSSCSSSPSGSPAALSGSMKTFGVSLESLSHHQHPHHHQTTFGAQHSLGSSEYYTRETEAIVVPHQKAAHVLGQTCAGCMFTANSNSNSNSSINDAGSLHADEQFYSMSSSVVASPTCGNSSSSSTSSTSGAGGPCLIPFIVTRLCSFIEASGGMQQEGLFRISGNVKLIEKLKHSFDLTGDAPLENEGDLASAAGLLKQFLRELPQPLLPNGAQFLDVVRTLNNDHDTCVLSLKALISQLPDENYYTLRYLIRFLHRIAARNNENRMTSSNLGIVFAPNIFRICADNIQMINDQTIANDMVTLLILEFNDLFNESHDAGGEVSSHEDLSGSVCDSDSMYPCSGTSGELKPSEGNDTSDDSASRSAATSPAGITLAPQHQGEASRLVELDRKRKEYQSRNLRTIEDDDVDITITSSATAATSTVAKTTSYYRHQGSPLRHPQRSNSDGNSGVGSGEEFCHLATSNEQVTMSYSHLEQANSKNTLMALAAHEIIVTNSSDSISTDDNTTTTATSTGATVCSVKIGGSMGHLEPSKSDQSLSPECSSAGGNGKRHGVNRQIGRTGSCGSEDCTENVNVAPSLNVTSDEDEDSLSKSIASDCSEDDEDELHSGSTSSSIFEESSAHDGDVSDGNSPDESDKAIIKNETKANKAEENVCSGAEAISEGKPWKRINNETDETSDATLCDVAQLSPSAYQYFMSNRDLATEEPPSPPMSHEARAYAARQTTRKFSQPEADPLDYAFKLAKVPPLKNRRLNSIRRKLRQFEEDFEAENNFRPRFEHKMGSSFARPLMIELSSILNVATIALRDLETLEVTNEFDGVHRNYCEEVGIGGEGEQSSAAYRMRLNGQNGSWNGQRPSTSSSGGSASASPAPNMSTEDIFNAIFGDPSAKSLAKIDEMMAEIQRTLQEKRKAAHRPEALETMSAEQIFDEKLALQKALLRFEALYGRPSTKAERDIVRPVYDRYRQVKRYASRMLQKINSKDGLALVGNATDLPPIIENVQMNFISPTHQPKASLVSSKSLTAEQMASSDSQVSDSTIRTILNTNVSGCSSQEENARLLSLLAKGDPAAVMLADEMIAEASSAIYPPQQLNFHEMNRAELAAQLRALKLTKRNLRSVLRTFENDFYKKTGKRVEKEDRCNMSTVYYVYKNTKGKIKLIEALINKHVTSSTMGGHRTV